MEFIHVVDDCSDLINIWVIDEHIGSSKIDSQVWYLSFKCTFKTTKYNEINNQIDIVLSISFSQASSLKDQSYALY